jgi:16S rRNA (guanine527-N7)-methyltransferase
VESIWNTLDEMARDRLERFTQLIASYRDAARLTGLESPADVRGVLVRDSLALVPFVSELAPSEVADLGSGAGVPGIPLAVAMPDISLTLFERSARKASFLEIAVNTLKLPNVQVAARDPLAEREAERFPCVVIRSVAPVNKLTEIADRLLAPDGRLMGFASVEAGENLDEEVAPKLRVERTGEYRGASGKSFVYSLAAGEWA